MLIEKRPKKYFARYKDPLIQFPNLIEAQTKSYTWLVEEGIKEVFKEFSPIIDYSGKKFELEFNSFSLSEPNCSENDAKINKLSYQGLLKTRVKLTNKILGTVKEQEIFMSEIPLMTPHGTFIINGVERVIVPQLARSFGVFFTESENKGKRYFGAKIIPARGVWIEIESESDGAIYIRIDKKRKFPATALLRVMGYGTNEAMLKVFEKTPNCKEAIEACLTKDVAKTLNDSYIEIYKRLRDGDMATAENAKEFIDSLFTPERYDLSPVGRFRFNKRFDKSLEEAELARRTISKEDLMTVITNIIVLNNTPGAKSDDIDHLGQRRVRFVGEMLQQKVRTGMMQIKRNIQDRMSIIDVDTAYADSHYQSASSSGSHQRIFHYQPAFAIYGARKCALRNGAFAYSLGFGSRRTYPRARRIGSPRRAPFPLREGLSDSHSGRSEHRAYFASFHLCKNK